MRVLVDGALHPVLFANPAGVGAILAEVDQVLEHRARGVRQILINGEPWSEKQLEEHLHDLVVADVRSIEIFTAPMHELVEESLSEVHEAIDELPAACHSLASALTGPDREDALDSYAHLAGIWAELFYRHDMSANALKLKRSDVTINGLALQEWQDRAEDLLDRCDELAAVGDAVTLAELLTYELLQFAEEEAIVLDQLLGLARAAALKSAK